MIFPFWIKLCHLSRAPITFMFFLINLFFFLIIPIKNNSELPSKIEQKISQPDFVSVQSYLYENYLKQKNLAEWSFLTNKFYSVSESVETSSLENFWFQLSFRDGEFLKVVRKLPEYPDQIRYMVWKLAFNEFETYQKEDLSSLFGVSINGFSWSHYLTYQFIHAGFFHFFSNMLILILFGVLIEMQSGSWVVLILYLIGGATGGLFYSFTTGINMAPLIGASGSVSALISFLLITEPRKNLRFFFFFFPSEDYFGDIYLSKWWLLSLLILGDLNSVLNTPNWYIGVAHTAHLGAIAFGLLLAFIYKIYRNDFNLGQTLSWVKQNNENMVWSGFKINQ